MGIVRVAPVVLMLALLAGGLVIALSGGGQQAGPARPRQGIRGWLRLAGLLLGLLGAVLVSRVDVLGRGLLVAAPVAAFGLLLGVLAAELAVRPPAALVVVVVVGVLLALLVLRTTVARPPVPVTVMHGAGPAEQAALAALAALAAQAAALDTAQRVDSAQAVVAAVGVLLSVPLAGMSLFAGSAVGGMGGCAPAWWTGVGLALGLLTLAAMGILLWCAPFALLGRGAPRLDDDLSRRG